MLTVRKDLLGNLLQHAANVRALVANTITFIVDFSDMNFLQAVHRDQAVSRLVFNRCITTALALTALQAGSGGCKEHEQLLHRAAMHAPVKTQGKCKAMMAPCGTCCGHALLGRAYIAS